MITNTLSNIEKAVKAKESKISLMEQKTENNFCEILE